MNESKTIREFPRAVHFPIVVWFQGVFVEQPQVVKFAESTSYTADWYAKWKEGVYQFFDEILDLARFSCKTAVFNKRWEPTVAAELLNGLPRKPR